MTNKITYEKLQKLVDLGISQSFINFVSFQLLSGTLKEKDALEYIEDVTSRYESRKIARPRHCFSRVHGRSNKKFQFWYK